MQESLIKIFDLEARNIHGAHFQNVSGFILCSCRIDFPQIAEMNPRPIFFLSLELARELK